MLGFPLRVLGVGLRKKNSAFCWNPSCFNWSSVNTPTATLHYFLPDIPARLLGRTTQRMMSLTLTWDRPLFRLIHRCVASGRGVGGATDVLTHTRHSTDTPCRPQSAGGCLILSLMSGWEFRSVSIMSASVWLFGCLVSLQPAVITLLLHYFSFVLSELWIPMNSHSCDAVST